MMTRKSSSQLQQQQSSSSSSPVDVSQYHDPAASLLSPPPPQSNPPSQNVIPSSSPSISASSVSIPNVHYTTTAKQSFLSHLKSQTSHQQHQLQLQTQTPVHVNETTSGGISSSIRPSNNSSIAVAGGGSGGGVVRDDLPFSSIQISATSAPIAPGTIAMMMGGGGRVSRHASRVTEAPFPGYGFDPNVFEEIMGGGGGNGTPTTQQPSPLKNIQQQQLQQQQENITTTHAQLIALRGHSVTPDTAISDMSLESLGLSEHRKGGRGGGGGSQSSSTGSNGSQRDEYVVVEKTAGLVEINWMGGDGGGGRQQQHPITAPDHHQHQHQNGIIQSTASSSGVTGDGYAFQYPPYLFCIPSMTTPSSTNHTQQRTLLLADESHIPFLRKDKLQDYMNSFEDMDTLNLCVLHGYAIHLLAHDFDQQAETKNHQQNQQDLSTHSSSSSVSASIIKYEAVNLFLAALALYQLGMDLAKSLWTKFSPPTASSSTDQYHCDHPPGVGTSLGVDLVQLRGLVHWTRHRFNECLDCASRWQQQQQKAGMTDHVLQNQHVRSAEKLIFLRAVEMVKRGGEEGFISMGLISSPLPISLSLSFSP